MRYAPWIRWEQISTVSNGVTQTSRDTFRNKTDDIIEIERVIIDDVNESEELVRFGREGEMSSYDAFIPMKTIQNSRRDVMRPTENWSAPAYAMDYGLLNFEGRKVIISPTTSLYVDILDDVAVASNWVVTLVGHTKSGQVHIDTARMSLKANARETLGVKGDYKDEVLLDSLLIWNDDTYTSEFTVSNAYFDQRKVHIYGGGMGDWTEFAAPLPLITTETGNENTYTWKAAPNRPIVLQPGEAFVMEIAERDPASRPIYVSVIGYRRDLRS